MDRIGVFETTDTGSSPVGGTMLDYDVCHTTCFLCGELGYWKTPYDSDLATCESCIAHIRLMVYGGIDAQNTPGNSGSEESPRGSD